MLKTMLVLLTLASPALAQEASEESQRAIVAAQAAVASEKELTASCVSFPLPATPVNPMQTVRVVSGVPQESADLVVWRKPCAGNDAQLLLTFVPVSGAPFICSANVTLVQEGVQIDSVFLSRAASSIESLCSELFVPTTTYLRPSSTSPFDDDAAFTLIYDDSSANNVRIDVPAYVAGPPVEEPFVIDARAEGTWFTPGLEGQGVIVDVDEASGLFVFGWYTAKQDNTGLDWMTGVGSFEGDTGSVSLVRNEGVRFAQPGTVTQDVVGTATIEFESCEAAILTFTLDGEAPAELPLARLTPAPAACE